MQDPGDIASSLAPINAVMKYLGFRDFLVEGETNNRRIRFSSTIHSITSITLVAVELIILNWFHRHLKIQIFTEGVLFAVFAITHKLQTRNEMKIMKMLLKFEKRFLHAGAKLNLRSIKRKILLLIYAFPLVQMVLIYCIEDYLSERAFLWSFYHVTLLSYALLTRDCITVRFYAQISIMKEMFFLLNSKLMMFRVRGSSIRETATAHRAICGLVRLVNDTMSVQILFIFGNTFLLFTAHLYLLLEAILLGNVPLHSVVGFLLAALDMVNLCLCVFAAQGCVDCVSIYKKM